MLNAKRTAGAGGRVPPGLVLSLALLACAALAALACAPKTQTWTTYREKGFDPKVVKREPCAVGGVVLRDGIELDRFAGVDFLPEELTPAVQADLWSPLFDDAFRASLGHEPAAGWFTYRAAVPAAVREDVLAAQARGSVVAPVLLEACRAGLPDVRYLLLARVEETSLDANFRGDYGSDRSSGRVVQMTLDVYDLASARSVWTHTSGVFDGGPGNPGDDEIRATRRFQRPDSTGAPVTVAGQVLAAPPLDKVMARTLRRLLGQMTGEYIRTISAD